MPRLTYILERRMRFLRLVKPKFDRPFGPHYDSLELRRMQGYLLQF